MTSIHTDTNHYIGSPKPSGPLPNRGITAPANITHGMPQKSGLLSHLARIAKARVNRGDSSINQDASA